MCDPPVEIPGSSESQKMEDELSSLRSEVEKLKSAIHHHNCDVQRMREMRNSEMQKHLKAAEEIERLKAENAALRELVHKAFREGVDSGMKEYESWNGGLTWPDSKSKQRLDDIGKGDG